MAEDTKEVLAEIRRLRVELQEIRDIVNTLFSIVVEADLGDDFEDFKEPKTDLSIYN